MADDHVVHVEVVFECLVTKNWHVKEKKCALFLPEVEFFGHVVFAEGVKVTVDKVDAELYLPTPSCLREVQSFLGLANFYRSFVKGFTAFAKPLTDLMRKEMDFTWGTEEEATFKKLKEPSPVPLSCKCLMKTSRMKSGWMLVTTLSVPRWYSKMITQNDGCQWSTCPTDCLWQSRITMQ